MNRFVITACAAFAAHAFIPFEAVGQKLSPNAEYLLATGGHLVRSMGAAAAEEPDAVSAYVKSDNVEALCNALSSMGIGVNSVFDTFVTAVIPVRQLRAVSRLPEVTYVSMSNPVELRMDVGRKSAGVDQLHTGDDGVLDQSFTGRGVVVGVIDSGIEFGHIAFRDADGDMRIKRVWDQTAKGGASPEGYDYGVEYTTPLQIQGKGYDTSADFHGCHTTSIAAGGDMKSKYYGVAPEADIVYVSFDNEDAHVADAIRYIFRYADEVGKPCVINMSLGSHFGPHNGTSMLDQAIDQSVGPGHIVVGAAGNEGEYNIHASKTFTEGDTQMKSMLTLNTAVSHKIHYLDIWGSPGTDFTVQACVVESLKGRIASKSKLSATDGSTGNVLASVFELREDGVDASAIITTEHNPLNDQPHASVRIDIDELNTGRIMGILVDGVAGQTIHMWNASLHEISSNGKSGWTDGSNDYTIGEIGGTAHRIISVGSYDSRSQIPLMQGGYLYVSGAMPFDIGHKSVFSSMGPTADGRTAPSILGPGMPVIAAYSSYAFPGTEYIEAQATSCTTDKEGRKYYYGYNVGTSMASPFVAGTVALMLEAQPDLTPEQAIEVLQRSSYTNDYMGDLPNNQYGGGRVNALEAVRTLLGLGASGEVSLGSFGSRAWVDGGSSELCMAAADEYAGTPASVYDATGRKVAEVTLRAGLTTVGTDGWPRGIYIVRLPDTTVKVGI